MKVSASAWLAFAVVILVLTTRVEPARSNTYDEAEFVRVVDGNAFVAKIQVWPGISQ